MVFTMSAEPPPVDQAQLTGIICGHRILRGFWVRAHQDLRGFLTPVSNLKLCSTSEKILRLPRLICVGRCSTLAPDGVREDLKGKPVRALAPMPALPPQL